MKKSKKDKIIDKLATVNKFFRKRCVYILPLVYLLVLVMGVLLVLINRFFPAFDVSACINLGGVSVCSFLGVYIATVASMPGYVLLGGIFRLIPLALPLMLSYSLLIVVNVFIYYIIGAFVRKLSINKDNIEIFAATLIIFVFLILTIILLLLKTL